VSLVIAAPYYVAPAAVATRMRRDGLHVQIGTTSASTQIVTADCAGRGNRIAGRFSRFSCVIRTPHGRSEVVVQVSSPDGSMWTWTWRFPS
jgi:hypothetical protein